MRIMVIDDSRAMRMIVMKTLRHAGFRDHSFVEAGDGDEALAAIEADPPDFVLSDWNMPKLSGIELLKRLRAAGNPLRFGFVTSECTAEMRALSAQEGALFMIGKPFSEERFRDVLGPFLS